VAKVFVVTSGKGGVGKTTITANLGCTLAKFGEKVCVIDADIGLKNLDVVLGLENRVVYTLLDVVNGKVNAHEALVRHKQLRNLYLLAASQIATKEMISPEDMKAIVKELYPKFDYVLIDSPAGIERGFRNAVASADSVLIVTTPEVPAISDADRVIGLLEKPDSEDVIIATNKGLPVVLNGSVDVSKVFENIARRLKGEEVSIDEDLFRSSKTGIMALIKKLLGKKRG